MKEKCEYPMLILDDNGEYKLFEKEGVEVKFHDSDLFKEFINNPNLNIKSSSQVFEESWAKLLKKELC